MKMTPTYQTCYYKQCLLERGAQSISAFIPEQFAIKNRILKLKINNKWENGFLVKNVYEHTKLAESDLPERK